MGRTTRWLRSLWGVKKEQGKSSGSIDKKEKRRWSFGKLSRKASATAPESWPRPYQDVFFAEAEKEQSKHAIVVAAATAAAADAAVAAAQAAAAVVRLTSHNRNSAIPICRWGHDHLAAVKIQTTYRGYLARKALRALKGLVKLQAHVRGYLVRKEAAATLHSMQALFRAQATIRRHQSRCCVPKNSAFHHEASCGRSMERFDETGRKNMPNIHSRRLSAAIENDQTVPESPKIVEIDTFRPKLRSRRRNLSASESFPFSPPYDHQSGYQPPIIPASSPLMPVPGRLSVPDTWSLNWNLPGDECRFSTAHSTPRFAKPVVHDSSRPATPTAKSVCGDGGFRRRYSGSPNYMSNTQSFRAKARSQSAPKHRPDPLTKRRLSLQEAVEARASLSGVRMQRSSSQAQEPFSFKHAVVNRLDRSVDACPSSCLDREYLVSLQTRW